MPWLLTLPFITAFLNRVRGGFLPTGHTQVARAIFAVGMSILTAWVFQDWRLLLTGPLWELGEFLPNGDYLGARNIWQDLEAEGVGFGNVLLPCAFMWGIGYQVPAIALLVAGGMKGLAYPAAKYIPSQIPGFKQGAEMAEFLFGMILGFGILAGHFLDFVGKLI